MVYDPYGALSRGFLGGLDYISRFRQMQQQEEFAPLYKEILIAQAERARQETQERRDLPAMLSRVSQARYQAPGAEDIGGRVPAERSMTEVPAGMSLADLNRQMRGAQTYEEVMQAIGPEQLSTVQRIAPYALQGLKTQEEHAEAARQKERQDLGWHHLTAATDEMEKGNFRVAAHKLDLGLVQLGQAPKMVGLADAIKTKADEERHNEVGKRIGPIFRKVLEGDTEAAGALVQESLGLPQDMQGGIGKEMRDAAGTVLGSKGDRKAQEGIRLYDSLLPKMKDPLKAIAEVRRQRPDLWSAMHKAKLIPEEAAAAFKRAGQRPSDDSIKLLQTEAIHLAKTITAREKLGPEQEAALVKFFHDAFTGGALKSGEDLDKRTAEFVGKLKGLPPIPLADDVSKQSKKVWGIWESVKGFFGAGAAPGAAQPAQRAGERESYGLRMERRTLAAPRPAPGRGQAGAVAQPPSASATEDDAIAEARRLMGLGLSEDQALQAMERAGWTFEE